MTTPAEDATREAEIRQWVGTGYALDIACLLIRIIDAERAKSERLRKALRDTKRVLTVPAAEYVPAIGDAFDIIDDALDPLDTALSASPSPSLQPPSD